MNVLAVGAHPDDIEFQCAGTLAKYAKQGHTVSLAVVTNGEAGSPTLGKEEIAAIRKAESQASAKLLGAALYWMDFPDEFLFNDASTRLRFIDMVRQAKPDLILCPHPSKDYHPDHTTAGQILRDIHVMASVPNIVTEHPPHSRIPRIVYMDTLLGVRSTPNRYVDITEEIEIKRQMLACHKSQEAWMKALYGVPPVTMMECFARTRGFQCGCAYAEAFEIPAMWPGEVEKDGLL